MGHPFDHDIAVIGGGPAGLQAAWKAALLHHSCVLFDKGRKFSRIFWSPRVDNIPGHFGTSGRDLIQRAHDDIAATAAEYGQEFVTTHENTDVERVERIVGQDAKGRDVHGFKIRAKTKGGDVEATSRFLIVATGTVDAQPKLRDFRKRDIEAVLPYANKGLADYCLLCDGHTVTGKRVAVIGCSPGVRGIAKSLKKNFGADTVLVPYCNRDHEGHGETDPQESWEAVEDDLARWEIPIVYGEIDEFTGIKDGQFGIVFADGTEERFDKAWISMGWYRVNNEPAKDIGGALDEQGFVRTDEDCRIVDEEGNVIPGAYAVGDVRSYSWKQIPIAWGDAERAVIDCFVS